MATDPALLVLPDGRRVQWWQGGDPAGRPVVLVHGCPDTRHAAMPGDDAARRAGIRLLAFNRPGYGRSDATASTHTSVADDLADLLDALGLGAVAVLGMSIGGPYAAAFAALHPRRVTRLAIVAAPGQATTMTPPVHRDDLDASGHAFFAELARHSADDNVRRLGPGYRDWVASVHPDDADDGALAARWRAGLPLLDAVVEGRRSDEAVAASVREALAQLDGYLRDASISFRPWDFRVEDVTAQTLLVYGELDANAPPRNGRWWAAHLADAELVVRPATGHLAALHDHWDPLLAWLWTGPESERTLEAWRRAAPA